MMDMLKVCLYSMLCVVSLSVVCLSALWKYDPVFTGMIRIERFNSSGLLWNITASQTPNVSTGVLVVADDMGRPVVVQHHRTNLAPSSTSLRTPSRPPLPPTSLKTPSRPPSPPTSLKTPSRPPSPPTSLKTPSSTQPPPPPPVSTALSLSPNKNQPPMTFGFLNYDIWHWIVGYLVDDMRIVREFPLHPDEYKNISSLRTVFNEVDPADVKGRYGHKIYGYLIPPKPGSYSFQVELTEMTAAAEVELWISNTSDPKNMTLILELLFDIGSRPKTPSTKSKESKAVNLTSGPCYFEFLEKAFDGKVIANVKWKTPSSKMYETIPGSNYAMAAKLGTTKAVPSGLRNFTLPSNSLQGHHQVKSITDELYTVRDLKVLPGCEFSASYAQPRWVKPYTGVRLVHESKVHSKDQTWFHNGKKSDRGNGVIEESVKNKVVSLYKKALAESKEVTGTVVGLHYLEETTNKKEGSRFLLEMDVQLHQPMEETVHTSEYVYLKKGSSQLCHTSNFQWTKDVEVHFVVAVKNLGLWVRHLIYNMEEIYARTGDKRFSLIIVDYHSEDMNIQQEAKKSSFKRIHVMSMKGPFTRSGGLQAGIDYVEDKNSIVMTIDMHLTLPVGIVEYVRKHTVQYKMGFTPMFFRLDKGYTEVNYNGFWETLTYGLYALYKSDWVTFGGFNTKKYKTKWGGEDWDILDRALSKGFEAFRVRPPGLVHYHHTRKGMWGNSEVKLQKWTLHSIGLQSYKLI